MRGTAEPTEYLHLARLVVRLSRHLHGTLDAVLQPAFGLSTKDHMVLRAIQEGVANPGAVTARLQIPPASVSRILERLRQKELIHRRVDGADQRRVVLGITPAGERLVGEIQALVADTLRDAYAHVPASTIRAVNLHLGRLDEVLAQGD